MALEAGAADCAATQDRVELADIFRIHGPELEPLTEDKRRVASAIMRCGTAALGGHAWSCEACGHVEVSYNSCRDRHCPQCQWRNQQQWLADRQAELLPVPYFHVVFTIPQSLHPLFQRNPTLCIAQLFASVNETLQEVALNPKRLGAQIGFVAVLHTWTQKLAYHPHLHCIVPGGGLIPGSMQWKASHPRFLVPVKVLSDVFRGKLLQKLQRAAATQKLDVGPNPNELLQEAARKNWVVYSKRPFTGPMQVLRYLARYTHRIAISNARIVSLRNAQVTFSYRDRSDGNRKKLLCLPAEEFLRRFLLHVLPRGLVRIRYFGLFASPKKRELLAHCRAALQAPSGPSNSEPHSNIAFHPDWLCPKCRVGRLLLTAYLSPLEMLHWQLQGRSTLQ
jgi:hypothetical protein